MTFLLRNQRWRAQVKASLIKYEKELRINGEVRDAEIILLTPDSKKLKFTSNKTQTKNQHSKLAIPSRDSLLVYFIV